MDIQPDLKQFYGKQTVEGAAWPNVSESALELFAESLIQKTCHEIRNDVIPLKSGAMLNLADWDGVSGRAAVQQASQIIDSYESIAAIAELIAISKAMRAAKVVVDTKHAVNSLADEVEKTCQSYLAASAAMSKLNQTEAANLFLRLIGWTVAWGRGINTATVASNAASLAQDLGVPPGSAPADGKLPQPASSPQTPIAPATDPSIPPSNTQGFVSKTSYRKQSEMPSFSGSDRHPISTKLARVQNPGPSGSPTSRPPTSPAEHAPTTQSTSPTPPAGLDP